MAQKPLLWVEAGAHAVRNRSKCGGMVHKFKFGNQELVFNSVRVGMWPWPLSVGGVTFKTAGSRCLNKRRHSHRKNNNKRHLDVAIPLLIAADQLTIDRRFKAQINLGSSVYDRTPRVWRVHDGLALYWGPPVVCGSRFGRGDLTFTAANPEAQCTSSQVQVQRLAPAVLPPPLFELRSESPKIRFNSPPKLGAQLRAN